MRCFSPLSTPGVSTMVIRSSSGTSISLTCPRPPLLHAQRMVSSSHPVHLVKRDRNHQTAQKIMCMPVTATSHLELGEKAVAKLLQGLERAVRLDRRRVAGCHKVLVSVHQRNKPVLQSKDTGVGWVGDPARLSLKDTLTCTHTHPLTQYPRQSQRIWQHTNPSNHF